ncbi:E3 ubiquitin-protein ligase TRIM21-like [Morone saxatilis]|uniref:E3 ubiquitin-protein ligase TRIM21-like n=1 Tax=Morone saxatilis TaxID=34816 RepID=UPI0015E249E3|nr:E3 ubiquitin-protein ligase TRIM21-like [Morone saxatilis]
MSAAGCLLTEDQLLCSICLDVFTLPVTLPCGHNFCESCITQHWDVNVFCICPMCKERFDIKPKLRINNFISDMANRFRQSAVNTASSNPEQQVAKPGEVYCDECVGARVKAVKSCLVCLTSYCETHLEPHLTMSGLKRHQLIDPVENLEDRMCTKHDKLLELFCRTDRTNVCMLCSLLDHKTHMLVPLKEEHERRKAMLGKTEGKMYRMIQERRLKIEEITLSGKINKESADRQMAVGVQVFTDLMQFLEGGLAELIEVIEKKLKTTSRQAEGFIMELEQEICELVKRSTEVDQLSRSDDHFHLLQSFSAVNTAPPTKDWTEVGIQQPLYEEMVRRVVVEAVDQLEETLSKQMKKLIEVELKRVQQCEVEVALDPETASPWLVLSDHDKQVSLGDMKKTLPKTPERFYPGGGILAKQSFSCGRFYYEVQVKEKMKWDLGVVRESISRKGKVTKNQESGLWILRKANEYKACDGSRDVHLSLTWNPRKIGVFVDYDGGLVSFYDVDAADLMFSFTDCQFTERLFPFFNPGTADPLIISPVNHSD